MIATKTKSKQTGKKKIPVGNGEVLTTQDLAHYLRVDADIVTRLASNGELPGRQLGGEWRFLKSAVQDWLASPAQNPPGIWALAGAWKDDPYVDEMLKEIYRQRGRPMTEEE